MKALIFGWILGLILISGCSAPSLKPDVSLAPDADEASEADHRCFRHMMFEQHQSGRKER